MDWKAKKWKFDIKSGKEKWMVLLAVGLICLILALPADGDGLMGGDGRAGNDGKNVSVSGGLGNSWFEDGATEGGGEALEYGEEDSAAAVAAKVATTYEQQLENRLEELLSHVDGVGKVEVMIVLKSSEEKVWRVDQDTSYSITQETDQSGGNRKVESQELSETTILSGQSSQEGPLLEKEIKPEIGGVVVSAEGGNSPTVQAEISAAVEALFDVPSHKIKVLKMADGM